VKRLLRVIGCLVCAWPLVARADPAEPAAGGLIEAPGWQTVAAHCTVCHSLRLVTAQRADREGWAAILRWMQETQNLWSFDPATEKEILDYLALNYAPSGPQRRRPLPAELLPPATGDNSPGS
jgi:hypothetical protein